MFRRYWWMLLVMIPVGMVVGLITASVLAYVSPIIYESTVLVEIRNGQRIEGLIQPALNSQHGKEIELLKSRKTLLALNERLKLDELWEIDKETVLARLEATVQVQQIRGTDLYRVKARATDSHDARDIASGIVKEYGEWLRVLEVETHEKLINQIRRATQEQQDSLADRNKDLSVLMKIKGNEPSDDLELEIRKRELEMELSVLEQLELKLRNMEIERGMIDNRILIHDEPLISNIPVAPNVPLLMQIGMRNGVLISPLLALPVMALLNRRRRPEPV